MIWRLLTRNLHWKLFAVLLAVAGWLVVVGDQELTTSVLAPIEYRNIPQDLEIGSDVQYRVHLEVKGPPTYLSPAALANTVVVLDLSHISLPGEYTFDITQRNAVLPAAVKLSRPVPAQLRLSLERRMTRQVPVEVRLTGEPQPGYRMVNTEVIPSRVTVVGPERRVRQVSSVVTDPVDVGPVVSTSEFRVNVSVPDPHVRLEMPGPVAVRVHMEKNSGEQPSNGAKTVRH
jgi:hypothetical protein